MQIHTKFWDANVQRRPRGRRVWVLLWVALVLVAAAGWQYRVWQRWPAITAQFGHAQSPVVPTNSVPPAHVVTNRLVVFTNQPTAKGATPTPGVLARTNAPPAPLSGFKQSMFEAQLALARLGFSSGSLDGMAGPQTRAALKAFQQREGLPPSGELTDSTRSQLPATMPLHVPYTVTTNDLARLQPVSKTWLGKSQQTALDYETLLEMVAEKSWSHPAYIRRINPDIEWTNVTAGTVLQLPNVASPAPKAKALFLKIQLEAKTLQVLDANTNVMAHFPCSIAQRVEKRPAGELHVAVTAANPNYTFDPEVFPESAEARTMKQKIIIPPGPNNPVGVAWIGLDLPGYGIHGTPRPEDVGRTESHGCFRLANWNAEYLLKLVSVGTPVVVEP